MKLKLLKKFMIVCMSFSLAAGMLPVSAYATGADGILDLGTPQGEQQMDAPDGPQTETQMPETQTPETERTTEPSVTPGFQAEEETQGETEPVADAQEPETEPISSQPEETNRTSFAAQAARSGKKVEIKLLTEINGEEKETPAVEGRDYTLANGKYVALENLKMIFNGTNVTEISVNDGKKLTLTVIGTKESTVGTIGGTGSVVIAPESNGRLKIQTKIADTVQKLIVNSGTLLGSSANSEIACGDIMLNGGSIACKIKEGVPVKNSGGAELEKLELTQIEKNAFCEISSLIENEGQVEEYKNGGIWSDNAGKVVLYFEPRKTRTFELDAVTFTSKDSSVAAERQCYKYNGTSTALEGFGNPKKVYTVKAAAELKTVYGKKAESKGALIISGTDAGIVLVDISRVEPVDERSQNMMSLDPDSCKIVQNTEDGKMLPSGSEPYEGKYDVTFSDRYGFNHVVTGKATLQIDKAVAKVEIEKSNDNWSANCASVKNKYKAYAGGNYTEDIKTDGNVVKIYDGTDEVPEGICSIKITAVPGDEVTAKAEFAFTNVNSKEWNDEDDLVYVANEIKIKDVTLEEEWDKYYVWKESPKKSLTAKILQKPCSKTKKPKMLDPDSVEVSYDQFKFKGIAGQECAFIAKDRVYEVENNPAILKFGYAKTYICNKDICSKTKYVLYTRIAETENYLTGEPVSSIEVETLRAPHTVKESDVSISGITDNGTYKLNEKLTLTAKGANPAGKKPSVGDEKYVPYSWKLDKKHKWSKSPYTAKITPTKADTYTVAVNFRKYVYDGKKWVYDEEEDVKKTVTFKANATGTSSGTSSGGSSSTISGGGSSSTTIKNTTAAKTGDNTPVIPLICVCALSGLAVAVLFFRKKGKK